MPAGLCVRREVESVYWNVFNWNALQVRGRGGRDQRERAAARDARLPAQLLLHYAGGPRAAQAHRPRGDALRRRPQTRRQSHARNQIRRRKSLFWLFFLSHLGVSTAELAPGTFQGNYNNIFLLLSLQHFHIWKIHSVRFFSQVL